MKKDAKNLKAGDVVVVNHQVGIVEAFHEDSRHRLTYIVNFHGASRRYLPPDKIEEVLTVNKLLTLAEKGLNETGTKEEDTQEIAK